MRIKRAPFLKELCVALAMLMSLSCTATAFAQNNQHSQVLVLPDPTPREMDPRLLYQHDNPNQPAPTKRELALQNEKRRQLIVWAANELVILSDRAEKAAASPPGNTSKAELAVEVNKIETLSKNLAAALKAH